MRITINGIPGSGKTTVARILSKKLGLKYYGVGQMRREIAKERGLTIAELNKIGEKDAWTDNAVDDFQKKLVKKDNFIADGRLPWYFIPNSIKVFLTVKPEIGAERIFNEKRQEERYKNVKEEMKSLRERLESDVKRYQKYYGIKNVYSLKNYDIVIDTSDLSINQMNKSVEDAVLEFSKN
jgi:predicted cytidylate kinase